MNPLTLQDLTASAFRILGLTAGASQAEIDSAARKMRIWQDASMIPPTPNDAEWIGPIARNPQDIEEAVARLADPLSRVQERFWWFCLTPPVDDAPPGDERSSIGAYHDAALIHLYRSLLGDISGDNLKGWQAVVERFRRLAKSDDYLQWLMHAESDGDFEKVATLDEIGQAQRQIPQRLSTALTNSVADAMQSGDFASARKAVQLVGVDASVDASVDGSTASGSDPLLDRMEEDLADRCRQLTEKIDQAWKTRQVRTLRPACNHVVNRFDAVIQPLIGQLVSSTRDVDRHNRARLLGVELLIHVSTAYEAFENFLAAQRALDTAFQLAHGTPIAPMVSNLQEKVRASADRQRKGTASGHRTRESGPEYKVKQVENVRHESGISQMIGALPLRWVIWAIVILSGIGRAACSFNNSGSAGNNGGNSVRSPTGN